MTFAHLPRPVVELLGELARDWTPEPRTDCAHCPLVAAGEAGVPYPFSMASDTRCCTAQPDLANFLAGRVIDRAVIKRRIANRDGVSAWGIRATAGYDDSFRMRAATGFGRDVEMRCPFWVGGEHTCGVWEARSARCRAFHCRHDRGLVGAMSWSQAGGLAVSIEAAIAEHLVDTLGGPLGDSDDELLAWFARCTVAADALDREAALAIVRRVPPRDDPRADRIQRSERGTLIARLRSIRPAMAERLVPAISAFERTGDDVWIAGYSTFDAVRAPPSIFAFLARLDGTTRWRDALAEHPELDEALVRELHRTGALRDPDGRDDPPES